MAEREILKKLLVRSRNYKCPACSRLLNTVRGYWAHVKCHVRRWKLVKTKHKGLSKFPCPICRKRVRWSNPYVLDKLTPYHVKCWFKFMLESEEDQSQICQEEEITDERVR